MRIRFTRFICWLPLAALLLSAAGCQSRPSGLGPPAGSRTRGSVFVLVPCGQEGPFRKVAMAFEEANPGLRVEHQTENIVIMTRKVLDGQLAPDVFLSMGDLELDLLEKAGKLLPGTRTSYAPNSLALLVPGANPGKVEKLEDLASPRVQKILLADPKENSLGLHAQAAMEKAGIWPKVKAKVFFPQMPSEVKQLLAQNKAQAGFAYFPCVTEQLAPGAKPTPSPRVKLVGAVPRELYPEFQCEAAVVKGSASPELGKRFIAFLHSKPAREAYRHWNFVEPPA